MVLLRRMPLLTQMAAVFAASMFVPAIHAVARDAHRESQAFFYTGVFLLALVAAIGVATARDRAGDVTRSHLIALLSAFTLLPAMAALPLGAIIADTRNMGDQFVGGLRRRIVMVKLRGNSQSRIK